MGADSADHSLKTNCLLTYSVLCLGDQCADGSSENSLFRKRSFLSGRHLGQAPPFLLKMAFSFWFGFKTAKTLKYLIAVEALQLMLLCFVLNLAS